ncbi:Citrate synthase [Methanothermus fervidus DSM 2088]|uniref:Citrate synthase n=1 Tax=Methanothermus fervidus (strain ATCC 43054 / DSM 2088 / JCM 10308 / V24 S) TaxID=523846 RepID=E3GYT9_METFV|nr:citryl-CoA lyase [Methanothermus fervidus]ADP77471.1 Citrate synthase [Methanothermus fervidus DSM 2088]
MTKMRTKWRTSITKIEPNKIIIRGIPIERLIGSISFPEVVYLLIKGKLPSEKEARMLEAVLVSFADHGVTPPSTQVSRIIASTGSPVNACIAGGLLAFGKHHAGAIEHAMKLFQNSVELCDSEDDIPEVARDVVNKYISKGKKIPGYGHRFHNEDPRPVRLFELAEELNFKGPHMVFALEVEKILNELKNIKMNVDGACASILSDLGFDWRIGVGMFMLGRLPGIIAHIYEERTKEPPFRKFFDVDEIEYEEEQIFRPPKLKTPE